MTPGDGAAETRPVPDDDPDFGILSEHRRSPPALPLEVFGERWAAFITAAAANAAAPADYVAAALLTTASALIGNARWAAAHPGWAEPPHLWMCAVGDSGDGKSPGADPFFRYLIPELERRMVGDWPERLEEWRAAVEIQKANRTEWKSALRRAQRNGEDLPPRPEGKLPPEPQQPRLRQTDVTIEKVASLLATAAPKGLLLTRDELAGWLFGMNAYNPSGRQFWMEAYGGRPYRVERQKSDKPIDVQSLVIAVYGGTQPARLARLLKEPDDGLLARLMWVWPEPVEFHLRLQPVDISWALECLNRLRLLELVADPADEPHRPLRIPLAPSALPHLEKFARIWQRRRQRAGRLLTSTVGKARGLALRLSLVLEFLWWCAGDGLAEPPLAISEAALMAAARLVDNYALPIAERVFGDAASRPEFSAASTLARWIVESRATEVHVRHMLRRARLPGLGSAVEVKAACAVLIDHGWLTPPAIGFGPASKVVYRVNPVVLERSSEHVQGLTPQTA